MCRCRIYFFLFRALVPPHILVFFRAESINWTGDSPGDLLSSRVMLEEKQNNEALLFIIQTLEMEDYHCLRNSTRCWNLETLMYTQMTKFVSACLSAESPGCSVPIFCVLFINLHFLCHITFPVHRNDSVVQKWFAEQ